MRYKKLATERSKMTTCSGNDSCTCHDELLIMMILLPNMMQSLFIFGFNVQFLCVRANRAISTGGIDQALANDVEGTMLFISGCTDSDRVIAKPHRGRSCGLDPFQNSNFEPVDFDPGEYP